MLDKRPRPSNSSSSNDCIIRRSSFVWRQKLSSRNSRAKKPTLRPKSTAFFSSKFWSSSWGPKNHWNLLLKLCFRCQSVRWAFPLRSFDSPVFARFHLCDFEYRNRERKYQFMDSLVPSLRIFPYNYTSVKLNFVLVYPWIISPIQEIILNKNF